MENQQELASPLDITTKLGTKSSEFGNSTPKKMLGTEF